MPQRTTNGQRAAVAGLIIAGVPYTTARLIVGATRKGMEAVLPGWANRIMPRPRWNMELLDEVKEAWMDFNQQRQTIAARYDISPKMLSYLAAREGWPKRRRGPRKDPFGLRSMTQKQLYAYKQLLPRVGRVAAREQALAR